MCQSREFVVDLLAYCVQKIHMKHMFDRVDQLPYFHRGGSKTQFHRGIYIYRYTHYNIRIPVIKGAMAIPNIRS